MERQDREEMELDLRELFQILKKRTKLIILITLLITVTSGIISFFVLTPIYQAKTELLVNKSEADMNALYSYNDIRTNLELINTYNVIIKSPRIIDLVINRNNLSLTSEQLINKINVSSVRESQVMSITVTDPDQALAAQIANAVATTFQVEISKIMKVDNVQILTEAKVLENPSPIKPNKILNIAIAFVLGLMLSIGVVFLLEFLDNTIKDEQEIEKLLGYPVLGAIATMDDTKKQKKKQHAKNVKQPGVVRGETYEA